MSLLQIPDQPLEIALYDQEMGEPDMLQINTHTGKPLTKNPWITFKREAKDLKVGLFTDRQLDAVLESKHAINIAWLHESPGLLKKPLKRIKQLENHFERIFTCDTEMLRRGHPYQYVPFGGTWVDEANWRVFPKTKNLSIIASNKQYLPGHKLRFDVVERFKSSIDGLYGSAFERVEFKVDGLRDFRFSFAIENCRQDFYFSEKLLDCFGTGTIPIYWGCPSIGRFFNTDGMIIFEKAKDLDRIIPELTEGFYEARLEAVRDNYERALSYRAIEQSLYAALHGWTRDGSVL